MADLPARSSVPWSLWRLVRFVFDRVIRDPIAVGRLKDDRWPPGLRGIVVAWGVVYVLMMSATAFGTVIRRHSPLLYDWSSTMPTVALPVVTVALIFGLTCLYTAALHLVWWLRLPVTLVVVAFLLRLADFALLRATDIALIVAAALLVAMLALRWRRGFHWLEFVVALAIIGHGVLIEVIVEPQVYVGFATDQRLNALFLLVGFAWCLAVPAGLVAGAAMAELTVSLVAWTVTGVWQELGGRRRWWSPAWGIGAVLVLVALRAAQVGWHVRTGDDEYQLATLLPSVAMFAFVLVACALIVWRADRVRGGDPPLRPDPDDVVARWSSWSMVLAVLLAVSISGTSLARNVLTAFGLPGLGDLVRDLGGAWQFNALVLAGAVVALVIAFVLSGRGQRVAPVMLTAAGAWWIAANVPGQLNLLAGQAGVGLGATLAAFGVFCWLLLRRRLTGIRAVALATVLVLSGVFEYRDVLEEPLTALFSLVGISAAVLVGLIWRMLTDSAYSRGDSRRFPRPSRVLVTLASTTYAVTSIGVVSLIAGQSPYDFNVLESSGDTTLGFSLACAAFFAGLSLAAKGRLVRPDPPRDDYGKLLTPGH